MTNHISSIYAAVEDVPLILAPQFASLKPVSLPPDFDLLGDLSQVQPCDFKLEKYVIAQLEHESQMQSAAAAQRSEQLRAIQEERIRKKKEAARRIAPGFLDTDRRILTPVPASNLPRRPSQQVENSNAMTIAAGARDEENNGLLHNRSASDELPNHVVGRLKLKETNGDEKGKPSKSSMVYLEFEQGLPPQNPWDLPNSIENDLSSLKNVIGPPLHSVPSNLPNEMNTNGATRQVPTLIPPTIVSDQSHSKPTSSPSSNNELRQLHLQPSPLPPSYAATFSPTSYSSTHIPSNPFSSTTPLTSISNSVSPATSLQKYSQFTPFTSSASSTSIASSSASQPFVRGRSASHSHLIPPSKPPKEEIQPRQRATTPTPGMVSGSATLKATLEEPKDQNDLEVKKKLTVAMNMGFSREQAIDALEKYDYDLEKATNYLLDNNA